MTNSTLESQSPRVFLRDSIGAPLSLWLRRIPLRRNFLLLRGRRLQCTYEEEEEDGSVGLLTENDLSVDSKEEEESKSRLDHPYNISLGRVYLKVGGKLNCFVDSFFGGKGRGTNIKSLGKWDVSEPKNRRAINSALLLAFPILSPNIPSSSPCPICVWAAKLRMRMGGGESERRRGD